MFDQWMWNVARNGDHMNPMDVTWGALLHFTLNNTPFAMVTIGTASINIPFIDLGDNLATISTHVHGRFIYILYMHWKFYGHFNFGSPKWFVLKHVESWHPISNVQCSCKLSSLMILNWICRVCNWWEDQIIETWVYTLT